jgi:Ca-activated chloride channel family protein
VTAEEPVSTFSIDVDTASYSFMRGELMRGVLPQKDAVRVEEMINYFPYDYDGPQSRETPFHANVQVIATPWNADTRLMRIGIKGYALSEAEKPRSNLVFLIDSSGSMNAPDKLPLLVNSFRLLLDSLDPDDTVAIVTYAGSAGTVLEPTKVAEAGKILASLERLHAGGSTAGAEGIRQAYRLAEQSYDPEGVNRVILATDGDFNVGITDMEELKGFIERKRETGVLQNGNGQAAYIDTLSEARKALVEEAGSTLFPIAKDVKIQIEFNPATVAEYRLIGYETRLLAREDFNNDAIDAGEIGSGHTVTALYEITPVGSQGRLVDDLRYKAQATPEAQSDEYGFLKIRYKAPGGDVSKLITTPVTSGADVDPEDASAVETRFAAAVAGFGQLLRGGRHLGEFSYDDVVALANSAKDDDPFGYRAEFVNLVRLAKSAAALEPLKP